MAKKSQSPEPPPILRLIRLLAEWTTRWRWIGLALSVSMIAGILLAAQFDPFRAERKKREAADLLAAKIRKEMALAARPCPVPVNGVTELTFKSLEFVPLTSPKNPQTGAAGFAFQAPPRIRRLDATNVRISGFALPIRYEGGRVQDFLILANQMTCCFGSPPRFCDFILAHVESGADSLRMDLPTSFEGTLHVRDVYADGAWAALYSMECTKLTSDLQR